MLCGGLGGREIWGRMDTYTCMAKSLCYPSKTITILLISYESESHSVTSDSLRPHGLYSPWNCPGQNTGGGSLSLFQEIFPAPGIEYRSPTLWADSLTAEPQGRPTLTRAFIINII